MPLHYHAWTTVLNRHGLQFPEALFYQWAGMPIDQIIQRLADQQGQRVDVQSIATERDAYFHSLPTSELRPVKAVVEIARRFLGQLPLAVATGSTAASASASLEAIGVLSWFDALVSSHQVARPKPAPDVFLAAAEQIDVPPSQCVVFEDGEVGLEAAQAADMHPVDIRPWLER